MKTGYDVIVVGAGHAGCEAAHAAAKLGAQVAICTLSAESVAHMPCNPAVGGTAKGHLVREIDALGGLMGRAIDATGIQFRLLNASRGPAVRAPRAQADKDLYAARMRRAIDETPGLTLLEGEAEDLLVEDGRVRGIRLVAPRAAIGAPGPGRNASAGPFAAAGESVAGESAVEEIAAGAVVVTSGTFLRGLIHVGLESRPGGRIHERAAVGLATITSRPYPDPSAENEKLVVVDIKPGKRLASPVPLATIKADKSFAGWDLLRIGRLSVVPVPDAMWDRLMTLSRGDS